MKRLRLLSVTVQPTFVFDDGDDLSLQTADPVVISAAEWATFAADLEEERRIAEVALNDGAEEAEAD